MIRTRALFRGTVLAAGVVGSALVLVSVIERHPDAPAISLSRLAEQLMAPAFDAPDPASAREATTEPAPTPSEPPRIRAALTPDASPPATSAPEIATAGPEAPTARIAEPAPAAAPTEDAAQAEIAGPAPTAPSEAPGATPGSSEEGLTRPGVSLTGLDRGHARTLFGAGQVALVIELEDERQLWYRPGPQGGVAGGRLVPWDAEAARGFSNWHWPIGSVANGARAPASVVPVALLRSRLSAIDPLARIRRISLALGPELHAAVIAAQDAALAATGLDPEILAERGAEAVTEGCWGDRAQPVRFTAVRVSGPAGSERRAVPGAPACP